MIFVVTRYLNIHNEFTFSCVALRYPVYGAPVVVFSTRETSTSVVHYDARIFKPATCGISARLCLFTKLIINLSIFLLLSVFLSVFFSFSAYVKFNIFITVFRRSSRVAMSKNLEIIDFSRECSIPSRFPMS